MGGSVNDFICASVSDAIALKQRILDDDVLIGTVATVAERCIAALQQGNKLLFAGNGGSAGDAQHLAAELVGRYQYDRPPLPAIALTTDTSMLTAIGNDYGYGEVFSRQLAANGRAGDIFVGISTSGNSRNVLRAMEQAREMKIVRVGLAGSGGKITDMCDYLISIPSTQTARIQECHIMIGHILCAHIERTLFPRSVRERG